MAKTFYDAENLKGLRNRTFFDSINTANGDPEKGKIQSEGAWYIKIRNMGARDAFITDGAGNKWTIVAIGGANNLDEELILEGDISIIRDDILNYEFDAGITDGILNIVWNRIVSKKDDTIYPQEKYYQ